MTLSRFSIRSARLLTLGAVLGLPAIAAPAAAQREIVQALPRAEADDLNSALRRLSANPVDLDALLQAGGAALALRDIAAAEGFYSRALEVAPNNGYVKLGLARLRLERQDPTAALRLFDEAERAGVPGSAMAAERAFAYDLVGDQTRAQAAYRTALAAREDDEIRRRLALSLAISGRRQAFEDTILPLLNANDRAAFRTRAFGLAILGEEQQAVVIAETMLPTDLALRLTPYLRYMPRLTAAQQAAAANLGVFPPADEIGRDDAAIAGYAAQGQRIARSADASLTPSGQPFARPAASASTPSRAVSTEPSFPAESRGELPPRPADAVGNDGPPQLETRMAGSDSEAASSPPLASQPALVASSAEPSMPTVILPDEEPDTLAMLSATPPETPAARIETVEVGPSTPPTSPAAERQQEPASVADAFADLQLAPIGSPIRIADAVDITAITPPREVARAEPAAPVHPARHWVQVATGRDLAALKFDWRRISRGAEGELDGKGPFTTPWGEANRLLAGPYPTPAAARAKVTALKAMDIDSFPFTSEEGEAIAPLD